MCSFYEFIKSTNDDGGIKKLATEWPDYQKTESSQKLRDIIDELEKWVIELGSRS